MGSSRKHKDKERDRDTKEKHRSRSRSKSRDRSDKYDKSSHRLRETRESHRHKESATASRKRPKSDSSEDERPDKRLDKKLKVKEVKDVSKHSNPSVNKNVKLDQKSSEESDRSNRKDGQQNKEDAVRSESSNAESLSIDETNKLRAKLGLKPLDVNDGKDGEDGKPKVDKMTTVEVFVKTENLSEKQKAEKIRERLETQKNKRKIVEKLRRVKGLADSDSEDEASNWVLKLKQMEEEKARAQKRAQLLEEMDEEFGVSSLLHEERLKQRANAYSSKDLKGLTVGHKSDIIKEGQQLILTLKDKGVLEEEEDVLVNVDLVDQERVNKNLENKAKRPEYRPFDEPEFDEFGILKPKSLLAKYDEELEGPKKESFKLGTNAANRAQELEMIRMKLKQEEGRISLEGPKPQLATEYYTEEEMTKFKKPKKKIKKGLRKKANEIDAISDMIADLSSSSDHGSRKRKNREQNGDEVKIKEEPIDETKEEVTPEFPSSKKHQKPKESRKISLTPMDIDDGYDPRDEDLSGIVLEEDEADKELQMALHKARKLKQRDNSDATTGAASIVKVAQSVQSSRNGNEDDSNDSELPPSTNIILNRTAEFCRNLGDIPTYGLAGNRDDDEMDVEMGEELPEEEKIGELDVGQAMARKRGQWNEVEVNEDEEVAKDLDGPDNQVILEEEPDVTRGLAGALQLAMKKGYLDKEVKKQGGSSRQSVIQAQSYTIEEKFYEDEKMARRERYNGPVSEFRERHDYKPDIKLDYVDEKGRVLDQKEAFRYLSHKFHGKGPSKNKIDKRMKKKDQESKLRQMSSTDTPLNTLKMLTDKQKEMQTPYIVLTGAQKTGIQASISKNK